MSKLASPMLGCLYIPTVLILYTFLYNTSKHIYMHIYILYPHTFIRNEHLSGVRNEHLIQVSSRRAHSSGSEYLALPSPHALMLWMPRISSLVQKPDCEHPEDDRCEHPEDGHWKHQEYIYYYEKLKQNIGIKFLMSQWIDRLPYVVDTHSQILPDRLC